MQTLAAGILSPWLVILIAAPASILIAGQLMALHQSDAPASTKRIRTAAGVLMLALGPFVVYLFGFASADRPREFILSWAVVVGLIGIIVMLAVMDAFNSSRIHAAERRKLRRELEITRARVLAQSRESRPLRFVGQEPPGTKASADGAD